jgi:hypothetical protein
MNVTFNNNSVSKKKLETLTIIGCFSADINELSLRVGFEINFFSSKIKKKFAFINKFSP